jgi:hypothetical protein
MIKMDSGVLINHAEILKETTAKYPLIRTEVKMNTCPKGSGSFIWQNVWSNNLPAKAYFAFIAQSAVNGSYTKNIFNFPNLADEIALYVNGESIPARPMKIDIGTNKNYVTPFVNLYEVSEKWNKDSGLKISRSMFNEGYAVYAFSLAPSDLGEEYINLVRQGSVRLEVKFATNTQETELFGICRISRINRNRSVTRYQIYSSMNARELLRLTRNNRHTANVVRGVFSSNNLPQIVSAYPSAYICNTDPSYLPGSHWVVFWIHSPKYAEFYDSLGKSPEYYDAAFDAFIQNNCEKCVYNNIRIQNKDSVACGYHVLFYVWMKCYNYVMSQIIEILRQRINPDAYVQEFVNKYL